MEWVRAHPYTCGILAAAILVIAGAVIAETHSSLVIPSGVSAWSGGGGALVNGGSSETITATSTPVQPIAVDNSTVDTGTLPYKAPPTNPLLAEDSGTSAQMSALLAELSHPSGGTSQTTAGAGASTGAATSAYAFIPTGTIAIQDSSQAKYTPLQQDLYSYANSAGTYIQAYQSRDAGAAQVLTNSVQSRNDSTKAQAVSQVGTDLITVGKHLSAIPNVPSQTQADNAALAQSYEAVGAALQATAGATSNTDTNFVASMQAYDTTVNTLISHYVALSLLLSANGVVFGSSDPGSVFTFSPGN